MPTIVPTIIDPPSSFDPPSINPPIGTFPQRWFEGIPSTGTPVAPLADPISTPGYHLPTMPRLGIHGQGGPVTIDTRTVDPRYGWRTFKAPFMAQGYYDGVPNGSDQLVRGNGTPNTHAKALRAGVLTNLAQYTPDQFSYSAAYVGALTPQIIPVGAGGVQA